MAEQAQLEYVPRLGYQRGFDGVRAIAVGVIVLFHSGLWQFKNGTVGVDIFFVLSGFLITSLLLQELNQTGRIDFVRFYRRRALRLLPAYVATAIASVLAAALWHAPGTARGVLFSVVYVSNWALTAGQGLGLMDHTWSLSIEEQFYLLWPIGLLLLWRLGPGRRRLRMLILASLILLGTVEASALAAAGHVNYVYAGTDVRSPALFAGCLAAMFVQHALSAGDTTAAIGRRVRFPGCVALIVLIVLAAMHTGSNTLTAAVVRPLAEALTVVVLLAAMDTSGPLRSVLANPIAVAIGRVSYGVYLWNYPIFYLLDAEVGLQHRPGIALLGMAITGVVCTLSYRFIELPFLRLKARQRPAGPARTSAVEKVGEPS
jgi:peptidoglycan/LPS O-acetylase OafA/YrhL